MGDSTATGQLSCWKCSSVQLCLIPYFLFPTEIYNPDGSHYIDGERFTKRPPINEDENTGGSGSANDRSTTDPNVISPGISSRFPHHTGITGIYYLSHDVKK